MRFAFQNRGESGSSRVLQVDFVVAEIVYLIFAYPKNEKDMFYVGLAALFSWIGWALRARWAALVAGILYAVSIVCMFLYAAFVLLEMIFCFVAFANMQRADRKKQE